MKNEKLFENIWITYHPKLQVYLKQISPYIDDVENRVSEILLKVFDSYKNYNPRYALSTWIYRIARNSTIDDIRRKKLSLYSIEDYDFRDESSLEEDFIRDEELSLLNSAIKLLEAEERELIYLYYYEDKNYREISEITDTPEGTLKYRMTVTRKKLRSIMEKEFV